MKIFNELTQDERKDILVHHISTEILVDRETAGFENVEATLSETGQQPTEDFQFHPTPTEDKNLVDETPLGSLDSHGRWQQMVNKIYLEKGKIIYKKLDDDYFTAKIVFDK